MSSEEGFNAIRDLTSGFRISRIVLTAFELGVFTAIGDGSRSPEEVAAEIGADARGTDRLLNALCAIGLIEKKEGKFSNGWPASEFLVEGKPGYMAGIMHSVNLWNSWSTLTEAVKEGGSVLDRRVWERGVNGQESFISAMHDRASRQAADVISGIDLAGVSRVLDVGGGPGDFAMAFVRGGEGVTATVFDLPGVVPLARRYIEEAGLSDRVEAVAGDFSVDDLGSGYDLVFISSIIHSLSPDENFQLISRCAEALNPDGRIVISDWIMSEDRINPPGGALFALNMLVNTDAGDTYTESEVREWMEAAGLQDIALERSGAGAALMTGRKPQGG